MRETLVRIAACVAVAMLSADVVYAAKTPSKQARAEQHPGGRSKVFHIDCGLRLPGGNPPWRAEHDHAIMADGYSYTVAGNAFNDSSKPAWNCWFFSDRGSITIRCPKGIEGTLYLHFLDMNDAGRAQTVTVCGRYTDAIERFFAPAGKWRRYELKKADTAGGKIVIEIVCNAGGNAVISRIDFVPSGMKDALLPEEKPRVPYAAPPPRDFKGLVESDWRRQEQIKGRSPGCRAAVADALSRGTALLADLRQLGAKEAADAAAVQLARCKSRHDELVKKENDRQNVAAQWNDLYLQTRWTIRRAAFANPLLHDGEGLLFVRRHHATFNHQCARRRSRYCRLGGEICLLKNIGPEGPGEIASLSSGKFPAGLFGRPDVSFDGKRIVFGYAAADVKDTKEPAAVLHPGQNSIGNGTYFQVWEMALDGKTPPRQITRGKSRREESTDPIYLPDGRIAFMSPRAGGMVQCGDWAWADCMFTVKPGGSDVRQITWSKEGEWDPSLMDDGSIVFTRWEYVMRFWRPTQLIWSVRPDGTNPRVIGGYLVGERNYARCRQIPGTNKIVCVESHHHNDGSGNILIVDLRHGRDTADGETTLVAGSGDCPFPLNENHFLISYDPRGTGAKDNRRAGQVALYLADTHGNLELIHRDGTMSAMYPTLLRKRPLPPVVAEVRPGQTPQHGEFFVQNVHAGLPKSMHGKARYLRVVQAHQRHIHTSPCNIWVGMGGFETKKVLGTVPVRPDGSAYFRVPAGAAVFFSVLDENHQALHTMRMTTDVKPGETVSCVGCHEPMTRSPAAASTPLAMKHPASKIEPPPWGVQSFGFPKLVQPILDKHCTKCHDGDKTKDKGSEKSFDLRAGAAKPEVYIPNVWTAVGESYKRHYTYPSYWTLLKYVKYADIHQYHTPPGSWGSRVSPLTKLLDEGHKKVQLSDAERRTFNAWIDCNVPYLDDFRKFAVDPEIRKTASDRVKRPYDDRQ